ncbi:MAG: DNA primase [Sulfuricurvum sp. GWF2_44_89]|uniref:DNA primase n=1 Tax=Sulfuricurvum kujiense TaxID=148813 RepID=A0A2D3WKH3_9BACT|nr:MULTISPECIES: DNA primase [Sulfuricurvum]OHD79277.1 MAG: DNA primase [Sulfuricurvum sp. GWF2_44_89]OHD93183.1 MAG: DNA primase [Sulfuricurvum sp. RIFOXYD12_FULL_44_77]OHD98201.1 MAG: DNA primase [Sulfuricurvum sp. RIFOXYD2_FULL_44_160]DAB38806.1 MAG TPA: DNA primase [Sulfuricurvum kujiense]
MITQDSIEALKARLDIVDIVGSYIELKRAGSSFKAPCPFHDEKSPSFVVNPSRQSYHCFGCGVHGDSIKFVMEYEKLNYPEAIEKLAASNNFSLHYTDDTKQKKRSNLLETLNDWYQKLLEEKRDAMEYLHERGIYASSIERFGIGYAPTSPETLRFLEQRKLPTPEAIEQGAIGRGDEGRLFARFIERITFPIHSTSGAIVGFGGRTITGHQAKYVNSSQNAIFNKSRLLYAYHLAREAIYRRREIIVTEGYLDVVMLHQAGFTHAVATLGTALTAEHLPLLRKGEPKIFLAYDGDKAGRAAAYKASKLLSMSGFDGGVVLFEGGLDPADMIKNGQIEQLNALLHKPIPFIEFVISEMISTYDLQDHKAKETALHENIAFLKTLSPLLQEEYRPFVASKLGISPSLIQVGRTNKTSATQPINFSHHDIWELSFIKTLLERPHIADSLLDFIDGSLLQYHGSEFESAIQGRSDDPRLSALMMDDRIRTFEGDEGLRAELITFLSAHYNRELKKVTTQNTISFDQKSYLIRQFREKIERLKRGELVPLT